VVAFYFFRLSLLGWLVWEGARLALASEGQPASLLLKGSLMSEAKREVDVWPVSSCGVCAGCSMWDPEECTDKFALPAGSPCGVCTGCGVGYPEYCTDKFVLPAESSYWDGKEVF